MVRHFCGSGGGFAMAAAAALAAACTSASSPSRAMRGAPAARPAPVVGRAAGPAPPSLNPGGMWLPSQMPRQDALLHRLGIDIDPALLADPASPLLQAMVSVDGCSGAFVSPEGLIITNHHCARGALQLLSAPQRDPGGRGFLAATGADEKWMGPVVRASVTQKMEDVTQAMTAGLETIEDDAMRHDEMVAREKQLVAECEGGHEGVRCDVSSLYGGALWLRIQRLEIRDVRLVYAPPSEVGELGGGQDIGVWPRHAGDFAFYRAYVGPDGVPADHSERNVPYRSQHRLAIASKPLREGDLVVVAGFPRATSRLATAAELAEAASWQAPRAIARDEALLAALRDVGQRDPDAAAVARPMMAAAEESLARTRAMLDGLASGGAVERRQRTEDALAAWIGQDPERQRRWGQVLPQLAELEAGRSGTRERDAAFAELRDSRLFAAAALIVRMADERTMPDAARDPDHQQRRWKELEAGMMDAGRRYQRDVDGALLRLALVRAAHDLEHNQSWLERALDRRAMTAAAAGDDETLAREVDRMVRRLHAGTRLDRQDVRLKLLRGATGAQLARSADPMIRLALALRPVEREIESGGARLAGAAALVRPRYVEALRAFLGGDVAPDANGTLRVAFGTVRGYRPAPDAGVLRPFTTLRELVDRQEGAAPVEVPEALVAAAARGAGPYRDHKLDDLPVDFLSDADSAIGNSGSATLNARGELCGLVFDNTLASESDAWGYVPDSHRSIHVDLRYAAWIMDAVGGADRILVEMGVTPSL